MRIAIVATGASMTMDLASTLADTTCMAINNAGIDCVVGGVAYPARVPHAVALCAQDHAWWREYPQAHQFPGRKFSTNKIGQGVETIVSDYVQRPSGSGVLALEIARRHLAGHKGPHQIDLYGFDGGGTHYFGEYPPALHATTPGRFAIFEQQLKLLGDEMVKAGIVITNRTPGSKLGCFPREPHT